MAFSATKETGYPASENGDKAQQETIPHDTPVKRFLSDKDRMIIRQTAWKVCGSVAVNFSSAETWFETARKYVELVEAHMKEA